jgi:DNA-binding NarL/FixJ family response regulator
MMNSEQSSIDRWIVWIVEDDEKFGHQLARLINLSATFVCRRVFRACEPALDALQKEIPPDLILMDIGLPGMNGVEGIRRVKATAPSVQAVVLTVYEDAETIVNAIAAGATGYLHKGASLETIVDSLSSVLDGGAPINPQIARKVIEMFGHLSSPPSDYGLTAREKEVLNLLVEGLLKKEIAERLFVSYSTIDKHLRNIYTKLQVQTRSSAVAKAVRERLL